MFRSPLGDGLIVLVLLLLFFGPKRLPMLSRSIGESIKEFKGGVTERDEPKHLDSAPSTHSAASSQSAEATPEKQRDTVA